MNWVIKLLDAIRSKRTLKLSAAELEILQRENLDSSRHAMPSVESVPTFQTHGNKGTDNSVVGAQYQLELQHVQDAALEASRHADQ